MIKMKPLVLFIALLILFVSTKKASAQTSSVVADGYANDWKMPLRFANKKGTLSYDITSDNKNIYFIAYSTDWKMTKRILKEGITLYFDPKGDESKKKMALTFPAQKDDINSLLKDVDSTTLLNTLVFQSDIYDAENFLNVDNGLFGVVDKTAKINLGLRATKDSGLVYEAMIPIECILKDGPTAKNLKKSISVGFIVHSDNSWMKQDNGVKNNNNSASAFKNDNGFGTRGGVEGLGGSAMQGNSKFGAKHEKEEEIWYTLGLANGK